MSSSKTKKVHYERGTKPSSSKSHSHRNSRDQDSGVGSSSASDRASLGTVPDSHPFNSDQIEDQRHILHSVQEALDAANEQIKRLESNLRKLDRDLKESNSENRLLRREKKDLVNQNEDLFNQNEALKLALEDERQYSERLKREGSPRERSSAAVAISRSESKRERRTSITPPRNEPSAANTAMPRSILKSPTTTYTRRAEEAIDDRSQTSSDLERERQRKSERRSSYATVPVYQYESLPGSGNTPLSPTATGPREPNPFTPISQQPPAVNTNVPRSMPPNVSMAPPYIPISSPGGYGYEQSHVSYSSGGSYAPLPPARASPPNDGKYHLYPL